jgi:hypothetical protein
VLAREYAAAKLLAKPKRTCPICTLEYDPGRRNREFCSKPCRRRYFYLKEAKKPLAPKPTKIGVCPGCEISFERVINNHTYCTSRCRERSTDRLRAAALRAARPPKICIECPNRVDSARRDALRCDACVRERKLASDRARTKLPDVTMACAICEIEFVRRTNRQRFCSDPCSRKSAYLAKRQRTVANRQQTREPRFCHDCKISIDKRRVDAKRCRDCAVIRNRELHGGGLGARTNKAVARKSMTEVAATSPIKQRARVEKPRDMSLPNFGGDWYPGWDGCWSPSVPPEGRAMIERQLGRTDPMKQEEAA